MSTQLAAVVLPTLVNMTNDHCDKLEQYSNRHKLESDDGDYYSVLTFKAFITPYTGAFDGENPIFSASLILTGNNVCSLLTSKWSRNQIIMSFQNHQPVIKLLTVKFEMQIKLLQRKKRKTIKLTLVFLCSTQK